MRGNNPDRQNIYGAALGLYNSRIVKLINKKGMLKSSVIIDELPTIYFKGLDNLIATARSNKVAVCLGFQDFSQLVRDYGDKEAKVSQRCRWKSSPTVVLSKGRGAVTANCCLKQVFAVEGVVDLIVLFLSHGKGYCVKRIVFPQEMCIRDRLDTLSP